MYRLGRELDGDGLNVLSPRLYREGLGDTDSESLEFPEATIITGQIKAGIDKKIAPNKTVEHEPQSVLRVAIMVPVFQEYENGNIFRLIECLSNQTIPLVQFELNLIINNTPQAADDSDSGYIENQATLDLSRVLEGGPIPQDLNDYRKAILNQARKKGLKVNFFDLSSQGIERNIGKIRDWGVDKATERFQKNQQNEEGIIAQLDADTIVEKDYIKKILKHFEDSNLDTLFLPLNYEVTEGPAKLFQTSFQHQYKIAIQQWMNLLFYKKVEVGGPQTIAKVRAYEKVGGIKHQEVAEDFELSKDLSQKTHYKFDTDISIFTADRAREEGFDSAQRKAGLDNEGYGYPDDIFWLNPRILFATQEIEKLAKISPEMLTNGLGVRLILEKYNLPYDWAKFQEYVLNQELYPGEKIDLHMKVHLFMIEYFQNTDIKMNLSSNEYVDEVVKVLDGKISESESKNLQAEIRKHTLLAYIRLSAGKKFLQTLLETKKGHQRQFTSKEQEFIERNPWLEQLAAEIVENKDEKKFAELKTQFPTYLADSLNKSGLRRSTAVLQGLTAFIKKVRNQPDVFPKAYEFLQGMS